jgi:ribosome-binding protein aMBF1 (putative translation factor)
MAWMFLITGAQIKAGRELLGWSRYQLAQRAKLHPAIIERAESATGPLPITEVQARYLRSVLEEAGVEFTTSDPCVRLRKR